ncbi:MAG: ABC transporter ATP-binding protein [Alphaproteobacteria bacterium]
MSSIAISNIKKAFGNVPVIKGVDLTIKDKEFVVFVGPSGCGKSTMLRLIAGLEEATSGSILLDDKEVTDLSASERGLAMVFQSYALYPHKSVRENMAFPLRVSGMSKSLANIEVDKAADILQLSSLLDRKPKELSGGQRQRVAIGRCIVRNPKAFLFDEPLSNLDAALRVDMRVQIAKLHRHLNATMIYVTHDQVEAMTLANRIVVFSDGKIEQIGTPLELYTNPGNLFVATFIGSPKMNIVSMTTAGGGTGRLMKNGSPEKLGIRPEHTSIKKNGSGLSGKISVTEHLGADSFYHVETELGQTVVARGDISDGLSEGDDVKLNFDPQHIHLFDKEGMCLTRLT